MPMYSPSPPSPKPPYSSGTDRPKRAHLGEPADDRPRGCRRSCGGRARRPGAIFVLGEARGTCPAPARSRRRGGAGPASGERGEERRVAVGRRRTRGRRRAAPGSTPHIGLAAEHLRRPGRATASATKAQAMRRLDVALGAVVEHRPGRLDAGRVGEVVGQHLVGVGPAGWSRGGDALADDLSARSRRRRRPAGQAVMRRTLPSARPGSQLVHRVGHEGARQAGPRRRPARRSRASSAPSRRAAAAWARS